MILFLNIIVLYGYPMRIFYLINNLKLKFIFQILKTNTLLDMMKSFSQVLFK